jgi:hypothetical protein
VARFGDFLARALQHRRDDFRFSDHRPMNDLLRNLQRQPHHFRRVPCDHLLLEDDQRLTGIRKSHSRWNGFLFGFFATLSSAFGTRLLADPSRFRLSADDARRGAFMRP